MQKKLNDLRAERAKAITDAEAILTAAETAGRDLTPAEEAQVDALIGTEDGSIPGAVAALDTQIKRYARVSTLKANLSQAADGQHPAQKPEATPLKMKRAEWDKLSPAEKAAYNKDGGKIED